MADRDARVADLSSYVPQVVRRHLTTFQASSMEPHSARFPAALLLVDITGFTPLTASAAARGAVGVEQLSRSFNAYLGQIID